MIEEQTLNTLEYSDMIKESAKYAVSYEGRRRIYELQPIHELNVIVRSLEETAEAKNLLEKGASVPLPSLEGIERVVSLLGTGYLFGEEDLTSVGTFLHSCTQLMKYMASKQGIAPTISAYVYSMDDLPSLKDEILRCIRNGQVTDEASRELEKIRRKISGVKDKIQKRMQSILSKYGQILQENLVSVRNGRYVIPVKKEYHRQVKGRVYDQSTSGQTVFVEPDEIHTLQSELEVLTVEETREEAKVLGALSDRVEAAGHELKLNIDIAGTYDFIFAKAKFAMAIGGELAAVNNKGYTRIVQGIHPKLLGKMVPLNIEIGSSARGMIITGPNTGGKTVVLKTVGLLTLMIQSGFLVPVEPGSQFAVYQNIRAVVGDGQSLEQSLSTFSAQITNLVQMLNTAGPSSLLLIDELAAGTDPGEGIALSVAILEELHQKRATVLVTTHFNELKNFASRTPGFVNARMEFDPVSLQPLYKLTIGEAGQSYALEIAQRLGMSTSVIERSREWLNGSQVVSPFEAWATSPDPGSGPDREDEEMEQVDDISDDNNTKSRLVNQDQMKQTDNEEAEAVEESPKTTFAPGDAVIVTSIGKVGIVSEAPDSRGMVSVLVQKQKMRINHKRLKPYISKSELYPEDYDFDVVFESKENRRKKKLMSKRHIEGVSIERPKE